MADIVAPEVRSRMMSGIRAKNTKPEMLIRCGLHALGFRFLLHYKRLPGKPDLVFPKYRAVIFVNGCFWHGHECAMFKWPKSRKAFWRAKIQRNQARDALVKAQLDALGWGHLTIWECALRRRGPVDKKGVVIQCMNWLKGERTNPVIGEC